jgi:hypothetical protein
MEEVEMVERTSRPVNGFTVDRLKGLTDGVLAIVITILVLGIDIPEDHMFSEQGLVAFLLRISRDVLMYAVSFWLIGAYWVQHHAVFQYLRYCNRSLMWLNTGRGSRRPAIRCRIHSEWFDPAWHLAIRDLPP